MNKFRHLNFWSGKETKGEERDEQNYYDQP